MSPKWSQRGTFMAQITTAFCCPSRGSVAQLLWVLVVTLSLSGCAIRSGPPINPIDPDLYVSGSVYTYQPLNPTTVWFDEESVDITSPKFRQALLRDLDTETVRISLSRIGGSASANIAVVGTSVEGESYALVIDYIKYLTSNREVSTESRIEGGKTVAESYSGHIPMYTGIGLRIRAEFTALESGLNISGLPALAIAASSNSVNGRLTVQTLGITGSEVTGLMPIISDISIASIQTAVQSVAAIKAKIYEDSTVVYPKIVGFEAPSSNPALIGAITEYMYGLELTVSAEEAPDPINPAESIVWIDWDGLFASTEDPE